MFLNFLEKKHSNTLAVFVKFSDILLYLLCGWLAYYVHFGYLILTPLYQLAFLFAAFVIVPVFSACGVYRPIRGTNFVRYFHFLYVALFSLMMLLASIAFLLKVGEQYSRAWFLMWNVYVFVSFTIFRLGLLFVLRSMRKRGANQKRIVIIGDSRAVEMITQRIYNALWTGFKIVAWFTVDKVGKLDINGGNTVAQSLPQSITEYIEKNAVAEVWLTFPVGESKVVDKLCKELNSSLVNIRYFPAITGRNFLNYSITEVLGLPVINVIASPMIGFNRWLKAIEDRVLSFIILVLISPLMLLIAFLVKLSSPGPIFYRQKRVGWNGEEFEMFKFRSMPVNAEVQTGAVWATAKDNRATKIGSLLRKTSLDELPQFINVLKGDMSIVGPRPERLVFVEKFRHEIPMYMQKHLVKAGITGWAQVNGWRGDTSLEKRIEYDLYYINHWSLGFDLKIIFLTIFKGFLNKNAY